MIFNKIFLAMKTAFYEETFDKKNVLMKYLHCALTLFVILFIVFIHNPVHASVNIFILLDNILLIVVGLICLGVSLLFAGLVFLLRRKYRFLEGILNGLLILCFINAFLFPFRVSVFDGTAVATMQDNITPLIRNIVLFLLLINVGFFFRKYLRYVSVPLILVCIIFTLHSHIGFAVTLRSDEAWREPKSREEILLSAAEFSSDKNIVVIVVDMLQGTIAEESFYKYPEYLDLFDGFTIFTRGFSSFPFSSFTQLTVQSGVEYIIESDDFREHRLASEQDSFMMDMKNIGGRVEILQLESRLFPSIHNVRYIPSSVIYGYSLGASIARLTGYWPLQLLITFDDDMEWPFHDIHPGGIEWRVKIHSIDLNNFLVDNLSVGDDMPKLLFFWNHLLHTPLAFDRHGDFLDINTSYDIGANISHALEETLFVYTQLHELFEAMKRNNVYDNSLIILVSDHGHPAGSNQEHLANFEGFEYWYRFYGNERALNMYNTAFFIKPPYSRGPAEITHDDVWTGDVRSVINHYLDNFTNDSPIDVVANIRASNPYVTVAFIPSGTGSAMFTEQASHQQVRVSNVFDIRTAFAAHSRVMYD